MVRILACLAAVSVFLAATVKSASIAEKRSLGTHASTRYGYTNIPQDDAPHDEHYHHHVHTVGRPTVGRGFLHGNLALAAGGGLRPYGVHGLTPLTSLYGLYGSYPGYGLGGYGLGGYGLGASGLGLYGGGLGLSGVGASGHYGAGLGLNSNLGFSYGW